MTDVYPHLQRYDFATALGLGGPSDKHQRRLLLIMTAMADHWSVVMPDPLFMGHLLGVRVNTVRDWLYQFHEDQWLSEVQGSELAMIHLPRHSAAYEAISQKFEWHARGHAPIGGFSRLVDVHFEDPPTITPVKAQTSPDPIPLTARALQLSVDSVGNTKEGQFAYIAFVQQALIEQPGNTDWQDWTL